MHDTEHDGMVAFKSGNTSMNGSFSPSISIKRFITLWVGSIMAACVVLSIAILIIIGKLESLNTKTINDLQAIEKAHTLELILLNENRLTVTNKDYADKTSNDASHSTLQKAQTILNTMVVNAVTSDEDVLIDTIEKNFMVFSQAATSSTPAPSEQLQLLTDNLLTSLENYREYKNNEMGKTIQSSRFLSTIIHNWLILLVLSVVVIVGTGSVSLLRRIVRPTIELSRAAARFGQGDFSARSSVVYNDELGNLCQTFNNMAEDIEHREKSRIQFIATVIHDIRNPLAIIGATARMLKKKEMETERLNVWLERVIREVEKLENQTHDLMDSAQIQTGQLSLQINEFNLTELAEEIYTEQSEVCSSHVFVFEGCDDIRILGDRKRLERVIINLLSNSIKYSAQGTTISLKVEKRDSQAVYSITDQGVGMSPEDIKLIFQPFGRLTSTKHMAQGTGLGLFSVKKIIEAHGGSIAVTSETGGGTTFEIFLPLAGDSINQGTSDT
ncbi:HAMP domain-containing histidine kinase [bacterium]|nr:HAMP domain-containing histidine kinase [bacterium]